MKLRPSVILALLGVLAIKAAVLVQLGHHPLLDPTGELDGAYYRHFGEMVARGELKAPIVIGRDHLDSGSVASPNRETESMRDGSDAVSDWPMLNALLNCASGATWVSLHHGGGVGIGYSLHAGQVSVADGTDEAAKRLNRVLTNDPGMGVARHVDAGYDEAKEFAKKAGVKIPMADGTK